MKTASDSLLSADSTQPKKEIGDRSVQIIQSQTKREELNVCVYSYVVQLNFKQRYISSTS